MEEILITSYVNPDIDGLACMVAYSELLNKLGKNTTCGILGIPHDEAKYVLDRFHIPYPQTIKDGAKFRKVILVDTSEPNKLESHIDSDKVVEIIDHRQLHAANEFKQAKIQIELVGAAATLVTERFIENKIICTKGSAILLYSAIISNTLNFKASVTTDRDHKAVKWLNKIAGLSESYPHELFLAKSDMTGEILKRRIVDDFATFEFHGKKRGIAQIEMIGTKDLVKNRESETIDILHELRKSEPMDYIFLSLVDLDKGINIFVTDDKPTKEILEKIFNIHFDNNIAELKPFLMRKQIGPLINKLFEN
jgi:manganese-dependent inorganic pyrophosphatase